MSYIAITSLIHKHCPNFTQAWWKTRGVISLMLLVLILPACTANDAASSTSETAIDEIIKPNTNLIGKTVTVSGEVEEVISPKAFTIEGDRFFTEPELIVLNLSNSLIVNDSNIQVTGVVRQLSKSEIKEEFDLILTQELEVELGTKPILVATALTLIPEPGEVAEEPAPFIGRNVTISGRVAEVIAPNAFTLDDEELIGGKELLVIVATGTIDRGKTVRVRGLIRKLIAAEIETNLDVKLQPELKSKYEGRAAAIAQSIEIIK